MEKCLCQDSSAAGEIVGLAQISPSDGLAGEVEHRDRSFAVVISRGRERAGFQLSEVCLCLADLRFDGCAIPGSIIAALQRCRRPGGRRGGWWRTLRLGRRGGSNFGWRGGCGPPYDDRRRRRGFLLGCDGESAAGQRGYGIGRYGLRRWHFFHILRIDARGRRRGLRRSGRGRDFRRLPCAACHQQQMQTQRS